jgi:hypothetical protein
VHCEVAFVLIDVGLHVTVTLVIVAGGVAHWHVCSP